MSGFWEHSMRGTRTEMTWADYLAVAVAPVLIMLLVGSLVFFLSDVGYAGKFPGVIRWVLFWFVFGSVMLARVSITQGVAHASFLGLGLALATIVVLATLVSNAFIACLLIGVVWWCAHKLTWNCTFIDETIDPSAAGLLETAGQDERIKDRRIGTRSAAEKVYDPLSEETFRAEAVARLKLAPWWKRAWNAITDLEPRAHAPGLSVLYFSLAALPLFGFGQWLIPARDAGRQSSAFRWLTLYLMAGLALLAITSFLGMRRYLRRRTLEMPASMTSAWVGVSAALIAALLIGGMLLPLPGAQSDLSVAFRDRVLGSPEREASKVAPVKIDGTESDDPDASRTSEGEKSEDQQPSEKNSQEPGGQPDKQGEGTTDQQSEGNEASGSSSDDPGERSGNSESQQSGNEPSESSSDESSSDEQQQQDQDQQQSKSSDGDAPSKQDPAQSGQQSSPPPAPPSHPPTPPNPLGALGTILRPLIWIAVFVGALVLAVVFRHQIIAFLREIAEIWRGIWQLAFPQRAKVVEEAVAPKELPRPFASFANPFRDGRAQQASPDDLVKYTFAALAAWSFEQGSPKLPDETPLEFAARASRQFPELGQDANRLAGWLARSLYARQLPTQECVATVQSLWNTLEVPLQRGLATAGR
jgi:hypothetical protein